jgi:hypothetical protein
MVMNSPLLPPKGVALGVGVRVIVGVGVIVGVWVWVAVGRVVLVGNGVAVAGRSGGLMLVAAIFAGGAGVLAQPPRTRARMRKK